VLLFLLIDPASRKYLRTPRPWTALVVSLAFTMPVILWNALHNWVSYRHVATQTGATGHNHGNFFEFLPTQFLVVGPVLAVMMFLAVRHAFRVISPHRRALMFLATIGLWFFALTTAISFLAKVQVNWPAPAYFTLMILTAYWLSTRLESIETWRRWRPWFWGTVAIALIAMPISHDPSLVFPSISKVKVALGKDAAVDAGPFNKLLGWRLLGDHVTRQLQTLGDGAFVLCDDYMQTAETAFYTAGQPKTYCMGSYYVKAKRYTQYDMWPDRALNQPKLIGRNAIFVGKGGSDPPDLLAAFERVEKLDELPVIVRGVQVKSFKTWRCYGFKGLTRPGGPGEF
jgi:hypothetical protein